MQDFLQQELKVGDYVATTASHYKELRFAKIIRFTPKGARVKFCRSGAEKYVTPRQVIKIQEDEALVALLIMND